MKHRNHAVYGNLTKLEIEQPLWEKVLHCVYVAAGTLVLFLLWTGL